jgi:flavin reductase (DIM6/NTAB) family NADH-FMN oxidoreductase RutF
VEDFLEGMRRLAAAVTVVTVAHGETRGGLTASAVTSLTADPPMLLACVNRTATSHALIVDAGRFAVNVLPAADAEVAKCFAGMTDLEGPGRFVVGDWRDGDLGQPVLESAVVSFECVIESLVSRSTHDIVIGEVRAVHLGPSADPLLYMDRAFGTFS